MSALKWFIAGCLVSGGLFLAMPQGARLVPASPAQELARADGPAAAQHVSGLPDFTPLIERVGPSVVNVTTRSVVRHASGIAERHYDLYRELMGEQAPRTVTGLGSGFVLGDDGYILTNAHVVEGVDEVYVRLTGSKRELKAQIVGTDHDTDIALLKVSARGLRAAPMGSSAHLRVGDWVAAIGSPFGFDNTITAGIISAKERNLSGASPTPFLQSDVAINPGSSGGPLVNLSGEVVGINSKIYTRTGGYMGVSFAIPIEIALKVSAELRRRGSHAAVTVDSPPDAASVHPAAAAGAAQRTTGLVLTEVAPGQGGAHTFSCGLLVHRAGGLARPGGLQHGDIIVAVADAQFGTRAEFDRLVEARAGLPVALLVLRSGRAQYVALESEPL